MGPRRAGIEQCIGISGEASFQQYNTIGAGVSKEFLFALNVYHIIFDTKKEIDPLTPTITNHASANTYVAMNGMN